MAARPAALTSALHLWVTNAFVMAAASVASPVTIVVEERTDEGIRERSFDSERTKTTTVWPWERRAGRRRDPRLPVGPRRRTFILVYIYMNNGNARIGAC